MLCILENQASEACRFGFHRVRFLTNCHQHIETALHVGLNWRLCSYLTAAKFWAVIYLRVWMIALI